VTSKKNLLSALAGLAMLALPATALAGHHRDWDDNPRPFARHNQGWHRGWFKHRGDAVRPVWEDGDERGHFYPRYQPPAALCDDDGDDCRPVNQGYGDDDDDYGPPLSYYQAEPPASYGLLQRRDWLIRRRQRAAYMLSLMRARHNGHAARRMEMVLRSLDARIGRDNRLGAGGRYLSPSGPYYNPAYNSPYAYNPNYQATYNSNYAYNPNYQANPGLNALTRMVGPLLGSPSY
jgi:hypothetical protein